MKKNRMMRLASVLLVCVLLTTSVISGTFAKYITTAEGSDTARVAKWGITMNSSAAETFKDEYNGTVKAEDGKDVVAPGTNGSAVYYVYGKPETAYKVTFDGTEGSDIYLGAGTYTYVDGDGKVTYKNMDATVASGAKYYPLEWKVTITTDNDSVDNAWKTGKTFATVGEAMTALKDVEINFDANEECDVVVTIAWEWDFDTSDSGDISEDAYVSNDKFDTILGDLAANRFGDTIDLSTSSTNYSLDVEYTVVMTATQVD